MHEPGGLRQRWKASGLAASKAKRETEGVIPEAKAPSAGQINVGDAGAQLERSRVVNVSSDYGACGRSHRAGLGDKTGTALPPIPAASLPWCGAEAAIPA